MEDFDEPLEDTNQVEYQKSPTPNYEIPSVFLQSGYPGVFPILTPQYYYVQEPPKTLYSPLDWYREILTGGSGRRGRATFTPNYPFFRVDGEFPGKVR